MNFLSNLLNIPGKFEVFEFGRKIYYNLSKKEPYSSYDRFSNILKNEKLESLEKLIPDCDKNIANMLESVLNSDEKRRAVVFSEISHFISLH